MKTVTVYIDQDYLSLGSDATEDDLNAYAETLSKHLGDRFECRVNVEPVLGGMVAGRVCPESEEIEEYVKELHAGDGWTDLLPSVA